MCTICEDRQCDVVLDCSHDFCRDCLVDYISGKVSDNEFEIMCPHKECRDIINSEMIKLILIDEEEVLSEFDKNIIRHQERLEFFRNRPVNVDDDEPVDIDVEFKRCPFCRYLVYKEEGCDSVKCPNCRYKFCFNCLEMFRFIQSVEDHGKKCEEFAGFRDNDSDDPD